MSGQIKIDYNAVYSKIAELRNQMRAELLEANTAYRHALTSLNRMDGSANAEIMEAVQATQRRTQATADTLTQLLLVMETSARQVERTEQNIVRAFTVTTTRRSVRTRGIR